MTLIQSEKKIRRKYRNNIRCKGCEKSFNFPLYACTECSFYLHKSCAELPEEFRNPFHPHPLTLVFDADISYACQACFKGCNGIHFCCEECDIDLDVDCALLRPAVEEGSKQLQHFTHLHPLALIEKKDIKVTRCVKCLVWGNIARVLAMAVTLAASFFTSHVLNSSTHQRSSTIFIHALSPCTLVYIPFAAEPVTLVCWAFVTVVSCVHSTLMLNVLY